MTKGKEPAPRSGWIGLALPWILAAAAFGVFLLTINPWVSVISLPQVAKNSGWTWQPPFFNPGQPFVSYPPAYFLANLPIKALPQAWIPTALNLFSALCGALALGLLARCVMLLPHDRTQEQRDRESHPLGMLTSPLAWIAPTLAVIVCGMQLSFWEHATNGTPETFDLLLYVIVIWSLLKYRHDEREGRLFFAAFIFAVGMANNYAMVGFLPLFGISLLWIRGLAFFNLRFLSRLVLCGLVGLSLYLLLPILTGLSDSGSGIWDTLKQTLRMQKQALFMLAFNKGALLHGLKGNDVDPLWVLALPSLLPLLLLAIRWPSHFGDTSKLGTLMTRWVFHLAHAFFLMFCIWITFDPPVSGRFIFSKYEANSLVPMLTFQFLSALCVGYFAGYFLLVFRPLTRSRRAQPFVKAVHNAAIAGIVALLLLVPTLLVYRNLPLLRTTNGPILQTLATELAANLPQSGVLFSDDWTALYITQAWLTKTGRSANFIPIDTQAFEIPAYHRYLQKRFPGKFKSPVDDKRTTPITDLESIDIALNLAKEGEVIFLHPSFGSYFEYFQPEPHGLTHRLIIIPPGGLLVPPLAPKIVAANEEFWDRTAEQSFPALRNALGRGKDRRKKTSIVQKLFDRAHIPSEENAQAKAIGPFYSRALNQWGVELQKHNEFEKAAVRFEQALELNPDNIAAEVNLNYNKIFREGNRGEVDVFRSVKEDFLGKYRNWLDVLRKNGHYDEPSLTFAQGYVFARLRNFRQAAMYFDRTRALSPQDFASRMWLAHVNLLTGHTDEAEKYAAELRAQPDTFHLRGSNAPTMLTLEASILIARGATNRAIEYIETTIGTQFTNVSLLLSAAQFYAGNRLFDQAQAIVNRQLKIAPNDPTTLLNKAILYMAVTNYTEAIRSLDQGLKVYPHFPDARLRRGDCYLALGQIDKAKADYEAVLQETPAFYGAAFGLHEIAFRAKDTNAALHYAFQFFSNAVPTAVEIPFVRNRVLELGGTLPGLEKSKSGLSPKK